MFGGANIGEFQDIWFPRLLYGVPTVGPFHYGGLCLSPNLTDAEIATLSAACDDDSYQLYGVDHLNSVVAAGHAPLPADIIVTKGTVESLTGLTPQEFADAASAAVAQPPGYFYWGSAGNLSTGFLGVPVFRPPIAVDPKFRVPHSQMLHVGMEREIHSGFAVYADYFFKDIRNILGVRVTNLAFEARLTDHVRETLPGTGDQPISMYGPWFSGHYQSVVAGVRTRKTGRFLFEANYIFAHATDNLLNASLHSDVGAIDTIGGGPTDSFVGVPPTIIDPDTGRTNANGPFVAGNGHPVPQAGKYYYGPDLDRGPSDLASATHTLAAEWPRPSAQRRRHFSDLSRPERVPLQQVAVLRGVAGLLRRRLSRLGRSRGWSKPLRCAAVREPRRPDLEAISPERSMAARGARRVLQYVQSRQPIGDPDSRRRAGAFWNGHAGASRAGRTGGI